MLASDQIVYIGPPRGDAPEGVAALWQALDERRVPVWQEDLIDRLLEDLAGG